MVLGTNETITDENIEEMDIFGSLLEVPMELEPKVQSSNFECKFHTLTSFSPSNTILLSSYLVTNILIAFSLSPTSSLCCTLNIWKPSSTPSKSTGTPILPLYQHEPNATVTHNHPHTYQCKSLQQSVPYIVVSPSTSIDKDGVISMQVDLFAFLFGSDCTLSQSLVVVYGCQCGLVLGCSLKRLPSPEHDHSGKTGCTNQQNLVYSIDQPVLSIHPFSLECDSSSSSNKLPLIVDSFLIIGTYGKVVLFKRNDTSVSVQEITVNECILSSVLIPKYGLLLSNLTSVQVICLRSQCVSEDNTMLMRLFEQLVTILHSPYHLLSYHIEDIKEHIVLLGFKMDGCLSSVTLKPHLLLEPNIDGNRVLSVAEQLKDTLKSIEETTTIVSQHEDDIKIIDSDLVKLNKILSLFGEITEYSFPPPITVDISIGYKQVGVVSRIPCLDFRLVYNRAIPLEKGCVLSVEMNQGPLGRSASYLPPTLEYNSITHVVSTSLEGLSDEKELTLKLTIPSSLLIHKRLVINTHLSFSPSLAFTSKNTTHHKSIMIQVHNRSLTPLDFIYPVKPVGQVIHSSLSEAVHSVTLSIMETTVQYLYQQQCSTVHTAQTLSTMLVNLICTSQTTRSTLLNYLTVKKDYLGNNGVELRGLVHDNSLVIFRLCKQVKRDDKEDLYTLIVSASTLLCAIEMADLISQVIVDCCVSSSFACVGSLHVFV